MVLAGGPFGLGPLELVIILLVLVMLFGATRLGELGGSLGKGIREFKRNVKDDEEDEKPEAAVSRSSSPASDTTANGSAAETVAAVKCPTCGSLNPVAARHCNQCGASLVAGVS
jgi:sec-independent protein translocase protein TatA